MYGLESRVTGLERDVHNLAASVHQIAKDQKEGFTAIDSKLDSLETSNCASKTTDWSTLAAWAVVILMVCAYVGNLSLSPLREDVNTMKGVFSQHVSQGVQIENLQEELTRIRDREEHARRSQLSP